MSSHGVKRGQNYRSSHFRAKDRKTGGLFGSQCENYIWDNMNVYATVFVCGKGAPPQPGRAKRRGLSKGYRNHHGYQIRGSVQPPTHPERIVHRGSNRGRTGRLGCRDVRTRLWMRGKKSNYLADDGEKQYRRIEPSHDEQMEDAILESRSDHLGHARPALRPDQPWA